MTNIIPARLRTQGAEFLTGQKLKRKLHKQGIENPLLLCTHEKSGTFWTLFVLVNYFNVLNNGATHTVTFDELNTYVSDLHQDTFDVKEGFPAIFRTHSEYKPHFSNFTVLFQSRHPLDVMISYYHYIKSKKWVVEVQQSEFKKNALENPDQFALAYIDRWISHFKSFEGKMDVWIKYEDCRADPAAGYRTMLATICGEVDEAALEAAVELSAADKIKSLWKKSGENEKRIKEKKKYVFSEEYNFVRSGHVQQYKGELSVDTIDILARKLDAANIHFTWPANCTRAAVIVRTSLGPELRLRSSLQTFAQTNLSRVPE
jgi:hypothetical protein